MLAPKLAGSKALFERAKERGEIRADVDIELLAPALAGIVLHRFFLVGEAPTQELVTSVIDQIILPAADRGRLTVTSLPPRSREIIMTDTATRRRRRRRVADDQEWRQAPRSGRSSSSRWRSSWSCSTARS